MGINPKKTLFPKLKKKINGFLTDESRKVSKRCMLGIGAATLILNGVTGVNATITYTPSPALPYPSVTDTASHNNTVGPVRLVRVSPTPCNHSSGIVNGHYSATPTVNIATNTIYNLYSHANHGSHSSHGSHCSGCASCSNW